MQRGVLCCFNENMVKAVIEIFLPSGGLSLKYFKVYANKNCIMLLMLFMDFNIKFGEINFECASVVFEQFQHILTIL